MTLYPGAEWRPSPNFDQGGVVRPMRGIVLHIAEGSYESAVSWAQNPASQVSAFFVNGKAGQLAQCVDLDNKAWTQGTGNAAWVGIENEGFVPDSLTQQQIENIAHIYAWLHRLYGVPVQITDDPINGHGLGWHGMGASIGWGHPDCPGQNIINQRATIVARTQAIINGAPTTENEMQTFLFIDEIHPGIDGNHPKSVTVQSDGTLILGNGAEIQGRASVGFNHLVVVKSELVPGWIFQGAFPVHNSAGLCIGARYAATDANGGWHPYVYYFTTGQVQGQ